MYLVFCCLILLPLESQVIRGLSIWVQKCHPKRRIYFECNRVLGLSRLQSLVRPFRLRGIFSVHQFGRCDWSAAGRIQVPAAPVSLKCKTFSTWGIAATRPNTNSTDRFRSSNCLVFNQLRSRELNCVVYYGLYSWSFTRLSDAHHIFVLVLVPSVCRFFISGGYEFWQFSQLSLADLFIIKMYSWRLAENGCVWFSNICMENIWYMKNLMRV